MGKATIKQNLGEGQYLIDLSLNAGMIEKAVATLDKLILELQNRIPVIEGELTKAKDETAKHRQAMDGLINQVNGIQNKYRDTKTALESGQAQAQSDVDAKQIAVNDAEYLISTTESGLKALQDEKARIEAHAPPDNIPPPSLISAIAQAELYLQENREALSTAQTELADAQKKLAGIKSQLDNLSLAIPSNLSSQMDTANANIQTSLYNERLINSDLSKTKLDIKAYQLKKQQIQALPTTKELTVWCADYSVSLSGDFATIDIPGELRTIPTNLKPGYNVTKAYDGNADGVFVSLDMMSPEQAWFNLAILPYMNKWKPKHRRGTITAVTGETFTVELEQTYNHLFNSVQGIEVTPKNTPVLYKVPAQYMDCGFYAFSVGDFVIVEFTNRDVKQPKVIGFVNHPKACYPQGILCNPHTDAVSGWGDPFKNEAGKPINPPLGTPNGTNTAILIRKNTQGETAVIRRGQPNVGGEYNTYVTAKYTENGIDKWMVASWAVPESNGIYLTNGPQYLISTWGQYNYSYHRGFHQTSYMIGNRQFESPGLIYALRLKAEVIESKNRFVLYAMIDDYLFYSILPVDILYNPNSEPTWTQIGPVGSSQPSNFADRQKTPTQVRNGLWPRTRWQFNQSCTQIVANFYNYMAWQTTEAEIYAKGPLFAEVAAENPPLLYGTGTGLLYEVTFNKTGITNRGILPYPDYTLPRGGAVYFFYWGDSLVLHTNFTGGSQIDVYCYHLNPEEKLVFDTDSSVSPSRYVLYINGDLVATRSRSSGEYFQILANQQAEYFGPTYEKWTWFAHNPRDGSFVFSTRLHGQETSPGWIDMLWNQTSANPSFEELTSASGAGLLCFPVNLY